MTEDEARACIVALVGRGAMERLDRLAALVIDENSRQNLIAASTIPHILARHVWDSVQLLTWSGDPALWLDIGTGGGFPGLAIACVGDCPIVLAEPRRRRAEFLEAAATALGLSHVRVVQHKVERIEVAADVISARAVGSVENLLRAAAHCARPTTRWLLPRGRGVRDDLESFNQRRKGVFHVKQSLSDPGASILIVDGMPA